MNEMILSRDMSRGCIWWIYGHELKNKRKIGVLFTIYFSHVVRNGLYIQGIGEHPGRAGRPDIPGML
jgi:hypothetical protein